jgi:hypothetical protein
MSKTLFLGNRSVSEWRELGGTTHQALIYGDYYFVETLTKLLRPDIAARAFPVPKVLPIT